MQPRLISKQHESELKNGIKKLLEAFKIPEIKHENIIQRIQSGLFHILLNKNLMNVHCNEVAKKCYMDAFTYAGYKGVMCSLLISCVESMDITKTILQAQLIMNDSKEIKLIKSEDAIRMFKQKRAFRLFGHKTETNELAHQEEKEKLNNKKTTLLF